MRFLIKPLINKKRQNISLSRSTLRSIVELLFIFSRTYQITLSDISNVVIDCVPYSVSSSNRSIYVILRKGSRYLYRPSWDAMTWLSSKINYLSD